MSQVISYKVELVSTCYYLETWPVGHCTLEIVTNHQLNAHLIFLKYYQKNVFWITEENAHKVNALPSFTVNILTAHKLKMVRVHAHSNSFAHLFTLFCVPHWTTHSIKAYPKNLGVCLYFHIISHNTVCLTWATHSINVPKEWIYKY